MSNNCGFPFQNTTWRYLGKNKEVRGRPQLHLWGDLSTPGEDIGDKVFPSPQETKASVLPPLSVLFFFLNNRTPVFNVPSWKTEFPDLLCRQGRLIRFKQKSSGRTSKKSLEGQLTRMRSVPFTSLLLLLWSSRTQMWWLEFQQPSWTMRWPQGWKPNTKDGRAERS